MFCDGRCIHGFRLWILHVIMSAGRVFCWCNHSPSATADTAATGTKPAAVAVSTGSTKVPSTTKSTSAASYGVFGASTIFGVSLLVFAASVLTFFV